MSMANCMELKLLELSEQTVEECQGPCQGPLLFCKSPEIGTTAEANLVAERLDLGPIKANFVKATSRWAGQFILH